MIPLPPIFDLVDQMRPAWSVPMIPMQSQADYESQFLNTVITGELMAVPDVETVYIQKSGEMVHVWSIVNNPAEDIYDTIYDRERTIIRRFEGQQFDFSVVSRHGRQTRDLISLNCAAWTRM